MTEVIGAQLLNAGSGAHLCPCGFWPQSMSRRIIGTLPDTEWHHKVIGLGSTARSCHVEQCFGCNQGVRVEWHLTHAILVLGIFADVNARGFWILHRYIAQPEISAAARNLSIAASPLDKEPLLSWANTDELSANSPAPMVAAPATANPFFMKERRPAELFKSFSGCFTKSPFANLILRIKRLGTHREGFVDVLSTTQRLMDSPVNLLRLLLPVVTRLSGFRNLFVF